jgi:hypothetical protein
MRSILVGFIVVVAALVVGNSTSQAGYNNRWCTDGGGVDEGSHLECSYYTLEQCLASAWGRGQFCTENPDIAWQARRGNADQRRSGRQRKN